MMMRNMQINVLRGLLYEFGPTFAKARKALFSEVEQALVELSAQLPQMVVDSLREQVTRTKALSEDILARENARVSNCAKIPRCSASPRYRA